MAIVAIPAWSVGGFLPPRGSATGLDRSPYEVSLLDLVNRFGTSPERCEILRGLLGYRAQLHQIGIASGFQWIDGSFVENVESLERRPPGDVDVVTFVEVTPATASHLDPIFNHAHVKATFKVDAAIMQMEVPPSVLVSMTGYWYSMWSHRRNNAWKGFLQIDLAPVDDVVASQVLAPNAGANP